MKERPIPFSAPMVRAVLSGAKTQTRRIVKPQPTGFVGGPGVTLRDGSPAPLIPLDEDAGDYGREICCPYGQPGDRLWVRETWQFHGGMLATGSALSANGTSLYQDIAVSYPADGARVTLHPNGEDWPTPKQPPQREGEEYSLRDAPADFVYTGENTYCDRLTRWWRRKIPAIHMPRWASRITLEVTGVRVERLQSMEGQAPYPGDSDALAEGVNRIDHGRGDYHFSAFRAEPHPKNWNDPADAFRELWESINGPDSWAANPWVWVIEFRRVTA